MNNVMKNVMNRQMMKTMLWATTIALGALCMTGCSNDDDTDAATVPGTSEPRQVTMTMQASTAEPQTRAHYTPGSEATGDADVMLFSWDAGDQMKVLIDENEDGNFNTHEYTLTTAGTGKSADFTGTVNSFTGEKTMYAVCPSDLRSYDIFPDYNTGKDIISLYLDNPQTFTVGGTTGGKAANGFLVGEGKATATSEGADAAITASASMKQVMSFVRLNVTNAPYKVTNVRLRSTDGSKIFSTQASVFLHNAEIRELSSSSGYTTSELTMNVTDETANDTDTKTVSFALFPQNLSDKEIEVEVEFAGTTEYKVITTKKTGLDFKRNIHYEMTVDASTAAKPAPRVGDFYYKDGTYSTLYLTTADNPCIGIVYKGGRDANDTGTYYTKNSTTAQIADIKGYVVALEDANESTGCIWGPDVAVGTGVSVSDKGTDFNGYTKTKKIQAASGYSQTAYPAAYYATAGYEATCPAPNGSSGWFLPSVGQGMQWFAQKTKLLKSMSTATGEKIKTWNMSYWTSSEDSDYAATRVYYITTGTGTSSTNKKDGSGLYYHVRSCLVF